MKYVMFTLVCSVTYTKAGLPDVSATNLTTVIASTLAGLSRDSCDKVQLLRTGTINIWITNTFTGKR